MLLNAMYSLAGLWSRLLNKSVRGIGSTLYTKYCGTLSSLSIHLVRQTLQPALEIAAESLRTMQDGAVAAPTQYVLLGHANQLVFQLRFPLLVAPVSSVLHLANRGGDVA